MGLIHKVADIHLNILSLPLLHYFPAVLQCYHIWKTPIPVPQVCPILLHSFGSSNNKDILLLDHIVRTTSNFHLIKTLIVQSVGGEKEVEAE